FGQGPSEQFAQPHQVAEAGVDLDRAGEHGLGELQPVVGERDEVLGGQGDPDLGAVAGGGGGAGGHVLQAVLGQPHVEDGVQVLDGHADAPLDDVLAAVGLVEDRKSTRLNSSHVKITY